MLIPMAKVMEVPYGLAPKKALSKIAIQEDKLNIGETYLIVKRKRTKLVKAKLTLIGCYANYYLFISEKGIKHTIKNGLLYWGVEV